MSATTDPSGWEWVPADASVEGKRVKCAYARVQISMCKYQIKGVWNVYAVCCAKVGMQSINANCKTKYNAQTYSGKTWGNGWGLMQKKVNFVFEK